MIALMCGVKQNDTTPPLDDSFFVLEKPSKKGTKSIKGIKVYD